jgi:hypothetical protein
MLEITSHPRLVIQLEPIQEVVESDESVVILCWRLIREGGARRVVPPNGGRKRTIDVREILNGIFYVLWTGCQWQALPKDLPPKSTVWA